MPRCDWCAKNIIENDTFIRLLRHRLDTREGLEDDYFEDGSHELLFHDDCFLANCEGSLILSAFVPCGCSVCLREFDGFYRYQIVTLEMWTVRKDAAGELHSFLRPFRDGTEERNFCYDCLEPRVDRTLLGIEEWWAAFG